jgi:hypothetical protein
MVCLMTRQIENILRQAADAANSGQPGTGAVAHLVTPA